MSDPWAQFPSVEEDPWARFPNVEEDPWARFPNVDPSVLNTLQPNSAPSGVATKQWPFVDARLPSTLPWLANEPTAYMPTDYPPGDDNWETSKFGLFGHGPPTQAQPSAPPYLAGAGGYATTPNPPTLSFDPPGSPTSPIRGRSVLTDDQIRNIVYNETRGLEPDRDQEDYGQNLSAAREEMANTIINADRAWGRKRPPTATDLVPSSVNEQNNVDLANSAVAVRLARLEQAMGIDSSLGATNYNFRSGVGTIEPPSWGKGLIYNDMHGTFRRYVGPPQYFAKDKNNNPYPYNLYTWLDPDYYRAMAGILSK